MAELLLKRGADANASTRDPVKRTPLFYACTAAKSTRLAELLLANGADINRFYPWEGGPLVVYYAHYNRLDWVEFLIEKGASPHATDNHAMTVLHIICSKRAQSGWELKRINELIKLLMTKRPNFHFKDQRGRRPIDHAFVTENMEGMKILLQAGSPFPLPGNTHFKSKETLEYLKKCNERLMIMQKLAWTTLKTDIIKQVLDEFLPADD
jgi:ankyrin repeat protein